MTNLKDQSTNLYHKACYEKALQNCAHNKLREILNKFDLELPPLDNSTISFALPTGRQTVTRRELVEQLLSSQKYGPSLREEAQRRVASGEITLLSDYGLEK